MPKYYVSFTLLGKPSAREEFDDRAVALRFIESLILNDATFITLKVQHA